MSGSAGVDGPGSEAPNHEQLRSVLAGIGLFAEADEATLTAVTEAMTLREVTAGEVLILQGQPSAGLFVVIAGRLRVERRDDDTVTLLNELGRGEVVGESAALVEQSRNASVRAVRDSLVAYLPTRAVHEIVFRDPVMLRHLARSLVERGAQANPPSDSAVVTIAVLAAGTTRPDTLRGFLGTLRTNLPAGLDTAVVTADDVEDSDLDPWDDPPSAGSGLDRTRAWLDDLERIHDLVLFNGQGPAEWSARCVRQADLVLLVAAADADPVPNRVEESLGRESATTARVELVVVRPHGASIRNTGSWLARRTVANHHHVVADDPDDHARIGRLVTGHGVALVLGGGGARGFAHLGVLRALEERGIPIDVVVGTSIGAVMGALVARGLDHDERLRRATMMLTQRRLIGLTLPVVALSSGGRVTESIADDRIFGGVDIEDLPLPFLCVSVDLFSGGEVVHDVGSLWSAVRASVSIPGVFPPVASDGRLLVDGGVLANLPVGPARRRLVGATVIAVDLANAAEPRWEVDHPPALSGWRVLRSRLNPFEPSIRVPGPVATLLRAREITAERLLRDSEATDQADLVIRPPTAGVGVSEYRAAPRLVEPGRRAAHMALDDADLPALARVARSA